MSILSEHYGIYALTEIPTPAMKLTSRCTISGVFECGHDPQNACFRKRRLVLAVVDQQTLRMSCRPIYRRIVGEALRSSIAPTGEGFSIRAVGALTSKPYAFKTRSWELKSTESIDIFDGVGSNIRIDTRGSEIMRVLPRLNEHVNEEWISDKSRFSYDGLKRQRLSTPMVRDAEGNLIPVQWDRARSVLKHALLGLHHDNPAGFECHAIIGPYVDVNAAVQLREQFYRWFPTGQIHVQEKASNIPTDFRHSYLHNLSIPQLEEVDVALLVGCDPRKEAPLLNARLRKAALYGGLNVGLVGCHANLTYPVQHLGNSIEALARIAEGSHAFSSALANASRPAVIVSNRALQRVDGNAVFKLVEDIVRNSNAVAEERDGFCVLHQGANTVGNLDIGFDDKYAGLRAVDAGSWLDTKVLFLLGADDIDNIDVPTDCVVIYQGHHGDRGAAIANIVLPGAAYTEKESTYVNTEGRVQASKLAFFPPGLAQDDARVLAGLLGTDADLQTVSDALKAPGLEVLAPHLLKVNSIEPADRVLGTDSVLPRGALEIENTPFQAPVDNFYMTDPITRSSKTMAKCTRVRESGNFP